jgi:hypothetical protein
LIKADAPQGSALGTVLYLLYVNNLPATLNSTMATFTDDTAVIAVGKTIENATRRLKSAPNKVSVWTKDGE